MKWCISSTGREGGKVLLRGREGGTYCEGGRGSSTASRVHGRKQRRKAREVTEKVTVRLRSLCEGGGKGSQVRVCTCTVLIYLSDLMYPV